jgi:hypothetical protein
MNIELWQNIGLGFVIFYGLVSLVAFILVLNFFYNLLKERKQ